MRPKRSLFRAAALSGVVAALFVFAHARTATAQTVRYAKACIAEVQAGAAGGECTIPVPAGKRFVIETVAVGGYVPSGQYTKVDVWTWVAGVEMKYAIPAGFQVLTNGWNWWGGALMSTVFSEGNTKLYVYRQGASAAHTLRMTASGYLEDK